MMEPSVAARATYSPATTPLALGRLSTITLWCNASLSLGESTRAIKSAGPPAALATTICKGFAGMICARLGAAPCVNAGAWTSKPAMNAGSTFCVFMRILPRICSARTDYLSFPVAQIVPAANARIAAYGSKGENAVKISIAKALLILSAIALGCGVAWARPFTDPRGVDDANAQAAVEPADPACHAATLVSTGGAFPRNPRTLAVRWTGYANFELVYGGQILLLDAYFDRGSMFPPLGFKAADVKRADVILLGHGHVDHMSDAASVGIRTGAVVVGAPVTTEKLLTQSIAPGQVRTVTG